jgi:hypothetical protein
MLSISRTYIYDWPPTKCRETTCTTYPNTDFIVQATPMESIHPDVAKPNLLIAVW